MFYSRISSSVYPYLPRIILSVFVFNVKQIIVSFYYHTFLLAVVWTYWSIFHFQFPIKYVFYRLDCSAIRILFTCRHFDCSTRYTTYQTKYNWLAFGQHRELIIIMNNLNLNIYAFEWINVPSLTTFKRFFRNSSLLGSFVTCIFNRVTRIL